MAETNVRRRKRATVELSIIIWMIICVLIFIQFPNTRSYIQKIVCLILLLSLIYLYFNESALVSIIKCNRKKYLLQYQGVEYDHEGILLNEEKQDKQDDQEKLKEDQSTSDDKSYEALKEDDENDDDSSISITIETTK